MALTFDQADYDKMRTVELEIANVLLRAKNDRVEAAVVAFACIRCARVLLDQYGTAARTALVDVCIAFLRRDNVQLGEGLSALLQ